MSFSVALRLGRVSNLPTVWTNVAAGLVLSGAAFSVVIAVVLMVSLSLFYVGGMFLNDYFDRGSDATERPERPIPAGQVEAKTVLMAATLLFLLGGLGLALAGWWIEGGTGWPPVAAGYLLATAIVYYDYHHKDNALSPLFMGACRMLVYVVVAVAVLMPPQLEVVLGGFVLLLYVVGLSYLARRSRLQPIDNVLPLACLAAPVAYGGFCATANPLALPFVALMVVWGAYSVSLLLRRGRPDVDRAVAGLIAGVALVDAVAIAAHGRYVIAAIAIAAFGLTRVMQRYVPAT